MAEAGIKNRLFRPDRNLNKSPAYSTRQKPEYDERSEKQMSERDRYNHTYQQLTGRIRESGAACFVLRAVGKAATLAVYAAYPLLLLYLGKTGDFRRLVISVLIPGLSFVLLSAVRSRINRPRPYETWDITPLIPKDTKGNSMPSRHVFSTAVIAMAWIPVSLPAGILLLLVAVLESVIRVLGGVHYPSDVAAGYLIGVLAGLPMIFL